MPHSSACTGSGPDNRHTVMDTSLGIDDNNHDYLTKESPGAMRQSSSFEKPATATAETTAAAAAVAAPAAGGLGAPQPKQAATRSKRKAAATGLAASAELKRVKLVELTEKSTAEQRPGVGSSRLEVLTSGLGRQAAAGNTGAAAPAAAAQGVRPSRGNSAVAAQCGLQPSNAGGNQEQGREGVGNRAQVEGEGGEVRGDPFDQTSSSVRLHRVVMQLQGAMEGWDVGSGVQGDVEGRPSTAVTAAAQGEEAVGPFGGVLDPVTALEELTPAVVGRMADAQQRTDSLERELASKTALHDLDKQMLTAANAQLRDKQRLLLAAKEQALAAEKASAAAEDRICQLQSQSQQLPGSLSAALAEKEEQLQHALKLAAAAEQKVKGLGEKQQGIMLQLQKAEAETSAAQQRAAAAESRAQQLKREKQELESQLKQAGGQAGSAAGAGKSKEGLGGKQNADSLIKLQQLLDQVLAVAPKISKEVGILQQAQSGRGIQQGQEEDGQLAGDKGTTVEQTAMQLTKQVRI